jgi:hypothetical protein
MDTGYLTKLGVTHILNLATYDDRFRISPPEFERSPLRFRCGTRTYTATGFWKSTTTQTSSSTWYPPMLYHTLSHPHDPHPARRRRSSTRATRRRSPSSATSRRRTGTASAHAPASRGGGARTTPWPDMAMPCHALPCPTTRASRPAPPRPRLDPSRAAPLSAMP